MLLKQKKNSFFIQVIVLWFNHGIFNHGVYNAEILTFRYRILHLKIKNREIFNMFEEYTLYVHNQRQAGWRYSQAKFRI